MWLLCLRRDAKYQCRYCRRNQRLSKPSPVVAVLSEEQARNVDIGRKIVRERRRRGARR